MTRIRTFYIHGLFFALGTVGAQFAPAPFPLIIPLVIGILVAPGLLVPLLRPAVWCLIGAVWALFRAGLVLETQWPTELEGRNVTLVGTIASLPQRAERYLKFDLDVERAYADDQTVDFAGRVRLRWYDPPPEIEPVLKAGWTWQLRARMKQSHSYYNPGGFDYEAHLFREHIRSTGYVRTSRDNRRLESTEVSLATIRQTLRDRLDVSLTGLRFQGLLRALAMGDRSAITSAEWETLRTTGTSHLIAISGLHVGFAAGIGALLGFWFGRVVTVFAPSVAAPRYGAISALGFALMYAALSGFEVPAQRAFIMASVFLLAVIFRRHPWNMRGLLLALVVVLVLEPLSVHDPGFWLSFFAVALILLCLARRQREEGRRNALLETIKLQWVLSLALLPLVAGFFGLVSLVSAPANMIAVPVVMFAIVPLCLLSIVLVVLGYQVPATGCLGLSDTILQALWSFLRWMSDIEYASLEFEPEYWQVLILLGGLVWILLARRGLKKYGLICAVVLINPGCRDLERGEFQVTVLDVGQGLSAVVKVGTRTLVYDTGPRYPGGFSLAKAVVAPYLRSKSIKEIDTLIVSHGDNDHRGGYEDLRSAFPVRRVLSSVADELPGAEHCVQGQSWTWEGVEFEMLHPEERRPPPHNNASCVLKIAGEGGSVLLTGDIEASAEYSLLRRWGNRLKSDVLLVPHQGSATSSTPSFLRAVRPEWAIVSAGYVNQYGHPRKEVLERYRARGTEVLNTASAGAVIVKLRHGGISVDGWREIRPRYWLDRDDSQDR